MKRPGLAAVVLLLVVVNACGGPDTGSPDTSASTIAAAVQQETTTSSSTTVPEPSMEVGETTTTSGSPVVAVCDSPRPITSGDPESYALMHDAVSRVVEHTNALGAAILSIETLSADWKNEDPVPDVLNVLASSLHDVETITSEVLTDQFNAYYDAESSSWIFPEFMHPLTPAHGSLEELAYATEIYESEILPLMFSMSSLEEAVEHWNLGASPCGHANGMVERLHAAHRLLVSYRVTRNETYIGETLGTGNRVVGDYDELRFAGAHGAPGDGEVILFRRWTDDGTHEDLVLVRQAGGTVTDGLALTGETQNVWLGVACEGRNPVVLSTSDGRMLRSWSVAQDWTLTETSTRDITPAEMASACATNTTTQPTP